MRTGSSDVFAALGDVTRRQLLLKLAESSPRTVTQLAAEFPITRQGITKHLDVLASAGLVHMKPHGRERRYTFAPEPLDGVAAWLDAVGLRWEGRLNRLKDLLESED